MLPSLLILSFVSALTTSAIPTNLTNSITGSDNGDIPPDLTQLSLGGSEDNGIECANTVVKNKPHSIECVRALLQLPTTYLIHDFGRRSDPKTIPMVANNGRCIVSIRQVDDSVMDKTSWSHVQTMGILLMSTCKYAFGQQSRTAGIIRFGQKGNLLLEIKKGPRPDGLSGTLNGTNVDDEDDDEPQHDPQLQAILNGNSTASQQTVQAIT